MIAGIDTATLGGRICLKDVMGHDCRLYSLSPPGAVLRTAYLGFTTVPSSLGPGASETLNLFKKPYVRQSFTYLPGRRDNFPRRFMEYLQWFAERA